MRGNNHAGRDHGDESSFAGKFFGYTINPVTINLDTLLYSLSLLQRIDLRDNSIQMRGMGALANVMKMNKTVTQIDLDDKPRIRIVSFVGHLYTCVCSIILFTFV